MILTRLGPEAPFYRALTPSWAYRAESGAGAAAAGGRFNRPGIEARYLADTAAGALLEYQQESALLSPATVATFLVTAEVIDFSNGYAPAHWSALWAEAYCNWKGLAFLENIDPPSWDIGDLARARGSREYFIVRRGIRRFAVWYCIRNLQTPSRHPCTILTANFRTTRCPGNHASRFT